MHVTEPAAVKFRNRHCSAAKLFFSFDIKLTLLAGARLNFPDICFQGKTLKNSKKRKKRAEKKSFQHCFTKSAPVKTSKVEAKGTKTLSNILSIMASKRDMANMKDLKGKSLNSVRKGGKKRKPETSLIHTLSQV